MEIKAAEFKARCLQLMNDVQKNHEEIVITKHGKPIAKLVPVETKPERELFGYLKDITFIKGDIISPIDEKWDADE
jgi:prevent-host-death family protein